MTKQYLIQVEHGAGTTDVQDEATFQQQLKRAVDYFVTLQTRGPVPAVTIVRFVDANVINFAALDSAHYKKTNG